jgi:hypothetical protein
LRKRKLENF